MRKLPHLVLALGFSMLAVMVSAKLFMKQTDAAVSKPTATISIQGLHRSIDLKTLPVERINDLI
jgi:hypothetical protein